MRGGKGGEWEDGLKRFSDTRGVVGSSEELKSGLSNRLKLLWRWFSKGASENNASSSRCELLWNRDDKSSLIWDKVGAQAGVCRSTSRVDGAIFKEPPRGGLQKCYTQRSLVLCSAQHQNVMYRIFSDLLHHSLAFPWNSRLFLITSVCSMTISIRSVSLRYLLICSIIRPFRVFCLLPSIFLFRLVSFQFSILGSDRSESGSLLSIRLHSCSATIPCFIVFWSYDLRFPFELWSVSYCSVLYINPASYVVIR